MDTDGPTTTESTTTHCLFCFEPIPQGARKCRFCGEWQKPVSTSSTTKKGGWEKFETVARTMSLLLIPVVLALAGNALNTSLKKSDVDLRMVELAVDILRAKPTDDNVGIRDWATKILDKHSEVEITELVSNEFITKPLPRAQSEGSTFLSQAFRILVDMNAADRRAGLNALLIGADPPLDQVQFTQVDAWVEFGSGRLVVKFGPKAGAPLTIDHAVLEAVMTYLGHAYPDVHLMVEVDSVLRQFMALLSANPADQLSGLNAFLIGAAPPLGKVQLTEVNASVNGGASTLDVKVGPKEGMTPTIDQAVLDAAKKLLEEVYPGVTVTVQAAGST